MKGEVESARHRSPDKGSWNILLGKQRSKNANYTGRRMADEGENRQ
jgi:hypothetical protein